jgi:hypothetical protein
LASPKRPSAFLRPFGSKRPEVERPNCVRLPVAFPQGTGLCRMGGSDEYIRG